MLENARKSNMDETFSGKVVIKDIKVGEKVL